MTSVVLSGPLNSILTKKINSKKCGSLLNCVMAPDVFTILCMSQHLEASNKTSPGRLKGHQLHSSGGLVRQRCILHHQGVQLILACSWAKPAIFATGREGMFFISSVSLLAFIFSLSSPPLLHCISFTSLLPFSGR